MLKIPRVSPLLAPILWIPSSLPVLAMKLILIESCEPVPNTPLPSNSLSSVIKLTLNTFPAPKVTSSVPRSKIPPPFVTISTESESPPSPFKSTTSVSAVSLTHTPKSLPPTVKVPTPRPVGASIV